MTLDEAITHAREVAEKQRKDNDNCEYKAEYGCKGCVDYYSKPCIECAEEHEQLAEWLEELKSSRQELNELRKYSYVQGLSDGYINAIDDFAEKMNAKCDGIIKDKWNSNVAPISWAEAYADFKDDIDKIVERLEVAKSEIASETYCKAVYNKGLCENRNCFECCAEYLIEIVKAGGKNVNS